MVKHGPAYSPKKETGCSLLGGYRLRGQPLYYEYGRYKARLGEEAAADDQVRKEYPRQNQGETRAEKGSEREVRAKQENLEGVYSQKSKLRSERAVLFDQRSVAEAEVQESLDQISRPDPRSKPAQSVYLGWSC